MKCIKNFAYHFKILGMNIKNYLNSELQNNLQMFVVFTIFVKILTSNNYKNYLWIYNQLNIVNVSYIYSNCKYYDIIYYTDNNIQFRIVLRDMIHFFRCSSNVIRAGTNCA